MASPETPQRAVEFQWNLDDIRLAAMSYDLEIVTSMFETDPFMPVWFKDKDGMRVLDYYPGTGVWMKTSGERGQTWNVSDVLDLASTAR